MTVTITPTTHEAACVCGYGERRRPARTAVRVKPQDVGVTAPRGRVLRTRRYRSTTTTTNYTLVLDSSSTGRESYLNVTFRSGGADV